jgi:hypothetical protein
MSTPPQGQNPYSPGQGPYAQGAQPYAAPGQAPYPPQGGAPYAAQTPGVPPQGAVPFVPAPPARQTKPSRIVAIIAAVVLGVAALGVVAWFLTKDDARYAEVGDCLKAASSSSSADQRMEVVDCSSSEAQGKVLKKVEGHFTRFTAEAECRKVAGATGYYAEVGDGKEFLLCLGDV